MVHVLERTRRQPRNKSNKLEGQELVVTTGIDRGEKGLKITTANSWCGPFCTSGLWVRCHEKAGIGGASNLERGVEAPAVSAWASMGKAPRLSTSSLPQLPSGPHPSWHGLRQGSRVGRATGTYTPVRSDDSDVMSFHAGRVIPAGAVAANPRIEIVAEDEQHGRQALQEGIRNVSLTHFTYIHT